MKEDMEIGRKMKLTNIMGFLTNIPILGEKYVGVCKVCTGLHTAGICENAL